MMSQMLIITLNMLDLCMKLMYFKYLLIYLYLTLAMVTSVPDYLAVNDNNPKTQLAHVVRVLGQSHVASYQIRHISVRHNRKVKG